MRIIYLTLAALTLTTAPTIALADIAADKHTASRVLLEKLGGGDFGHLNEIYGPGFVVHSGERSFDLDYDNASTRELRKAVPDMKVIVLRVLGDGELVAVHWSASGTNSVAAAGLPGNGKQGSVNGMTMFRFQKARIVEEWTVSSIRWN